MIFCTLCAIILHIIFNLTGGDVEVIRECGAGSSLNKGELTINSEQNQPELLYDRERLAELSKLAIGRRSLREFSELSGLSEGFLSRLTTGKLESPPTKRSLSKLISNDTSPQNGITLGDVMRAAGYNFSGTQDEGSQTQKEVPEFVYTAAFAPYLTASNLEESGQLMPDYEQKTQTGIFTISPSSKASKKIVGIPAFCPNDFSINDELEKIYLSLIVAVNIHDKERNKKFFVILTNQKAIYDHFDKEKIPFFGAELYIVLTEDYRTFSRQKTVLTVNADGKPEIVKEKKLSYDFTLKKAI